MNIVTFDTGYGKVEVRYDIVDGRAVGEAYFKQFDLLAPVIDGCFEQPMVGTEYQVHLSVATPGLVRLEMRTWVLVDEKKATKED